MKRILALLILGMGLSTAVAGAVGPSLPKQSGFVNDFARVISQKDHQRLTALLTELEQKTGAEITVVTVKSIAPDDIETVANALFHQWGIGKKGRDNGVLLLMALEEKKVRIEIGYGLEGTITDGTVGAILDQRILPHFRNGDIGQGLLSGAATVASLIAQESGVVLTGAVATRPQPPKGNPLGNIIFLFLMGGLFFLLGPSRFFSILFWMLLLGAGGGRSSYGNHYGGGFGSFGGGFGGFGGGLSGGGGASRGW